jgi:hypothetical protein
MNQTNRAKRYHLNVLGDFYVEDSCCTWCGVPEQASAFFETDHVRHQQCFVKKQPATPQETAAVIAVLKQSEFGCIRYAGRDLTILGRLARSFRGQCDEMVLDDALWRDALDAEEPTPVERLSRVARELRDTGASVEELLRDIRLDDVTSEITPEAVLEALRDDATLIDDWLRYSANKQTTDGFYFRQIGDGWYEAGTVGGNRERYAFERGLIGCASFIAGEYSRLRATAPAS